MNKDIFKQNLLNNCINIEEILLGVGYNFENIIQLEPTEKITTRDIHRFWMTKIRKIDEDNYLHIGRHPLFGIIFRDIINNLYYVHRDAISSWYSVL